LDDVPRYMVRDRDGIYGGHFRSRVEGMGIEEILIAPKSPWQNCYVERVIGSIRRECLNHVIIINHQQLRRVLNEYFRYYHNSRPHLSLEKDAPDSGPFNRTNRNRSFRFRKSADCTIDTNAAPHGLTFMNLWPGLLRLCSGGMLQHGESG
jgi:hypothetical protein